MSEELEPREEDRVMSVKPFHRAGKGPWYTNIEFVHLIRNWQTGKGYIVLDHRKTRGEQDADRRPLTTSEKAFLMLKGELV